MVLTLSSALVAGRIYGFQIWPGELASQLVGQPTDQQLAGPLAQSDGQPIGHQDGQLDEQLTDQLASQLRGIAKGAASLPVYQTSKSWMSGAAREEGGLKN